MAYVKITHPDINSGSPVYILCNNVTVSGTKKLDTTPNVNIQDGPVEVQTQSFENLNYSINGIHFTGESGTLTWLDLLTLYKSKYDGTNPAVLNVSYGTNVILSGLSASTDINVVLKSLNFPLSTADSKNAYQPIGTISFVETE